MQPNRKLALSKEVLCGLQMTSSMLLMISTAVNGFLPYKSVVDTRKPSIQVQTSSRKF